MASTIKVSEMPEATEIENEDVMMVVQSSENKKIPWSKCKEDIKMGMFSYDSDTETLVIISDSES